MKKTLIVLMALVLVIGLAACGGNKKADEDYNYMTAEEMNKVLDNADYVILDVRKAADYETGHVPGAVSADMDPAVQGDEAKAKEVMQQTIDNIGTDKNVVLVCYSGARYAQAGTKALKELGYDEDKIYTLEGGMKEWNKKKSENMPNVEMQRISAAEAAEHINDDDYLFIDVRKTADYEDKHITGAVPYDMDPVVEGQVEKGYATLAPLLETDKNLVVICYSGNKYAQLTTDILSELGYDMSKVYTLDGGMKNWVEEEPELVE